MKKVNFYEKSLIFLPVLSLAFVAIGYSAWNSFFETTSTGDKAKPTQSLYTLIINRVTGPGVSENYSTLTGLEATTTVDLPIFYNEGFDFKGYGKNANGNPDAVTNSPILLPYDTSTHSFDNMQCKMSFIIENFGLPNSDTINIYGYNSRELSKDYVRFTFDVQSIKKMDGTDSNTTAPSNIPDIIKPASANFHFYDLNIDLDGFIINSFVYNTETKYMNDTIDTTGTTANRTINLGLNLIENS